MFARANAIGVAELPLRELHTVLHMSTAAWLIRGIIASILRRTVSRFPLTETSHKKCDSPDN